MISASLHATRTLKWEDGQSVSFLTAATEDVMVMDLPDRLMRRYAEASR